MATPNRAVLYPLPLKSDTRQHSIATLPAWAQELILRQQYQIEQLQAGVAGLQRASMVLNEREWFTVDADKGRDGQEGHRVIFTLEHNQAVSLCHIYEGDILLIGRSWARGYGGRANPDYRPGFQEQREERAIAEGRADGRTQANQQNADDPD